jgi:hypothetical protein
LRNVLLLVAEVALRLGLVKCLVPGERVELAASGAWRVWFQASWTVDDIDSYFAQECDAALEGRVRGECAVDEREHHDGCAQADSFTRMPRA